VSDGASAPAFVLCADRLGSVLDDGKSISFGRLHHGVHLRHLPIEVHRDDGTRSVGDLRGELRCVEVIGRGIDVHEDRDGPHARDRAHGGEERERCGQNLVARADALRHETGEERVAADETPTPCEHAE